MLLNIDHFYIIKTALYCQLGKFPEPIFDGVFKIVENRVINNAHIRFVLETNGGKKINAILYNAGDEKIESIKNWEYISIIFYLRISYYGSAPELQLVIEHCDRHNRNIGNEQSSI